MAQKQNSLDQSEGDACKIFLLDIKQHLSQYIRCTSLFRELQSDKDDDVRKT